MPNLRQMLPLHSPAWHTFVPSLHSVSLSFLFTGFGHLNKNTFLSKVFLNQNVCIFLGSVWIRTVLPQSRGPSKWALNLHRFVRTTTHRKSSDLSSKWETTHSSDSGQVWILFSPLQHQPTNTDSREKLHTVIQLNLTCELFVQAPSSV